MPPVDERTPPMNPQLALRVAIVGSCALIMFAIIFFRLWFLQVLSGSEYANQAKANILRAIPVAAPRGEILDRNGNVLVDSEPVPVVQISAPDLPVPVTPDVASLSTPPARDEAVYNRLAHALSISTKPIRCKYSLVAGTKTHHYNPRLTPIACDVAKSVSQAAYANVTIKSDISPDVDAYLAENQLEFPGVVREDSYVRKYPHATLAAQLFGTLGPLSPAEVNTKTGTGKKPFSGIPEADVVGQTGLEYQYNKYLQGTDGHDTVRVNSAGQFEGYGKKKQPQQGESLRLSIDSNLQRVGEQALAHSIAVNPGANGGAFVAMDPDNGQVLAMGSNPTFNPSAFTKPMSQRQYDQEFRDNPGHPLVNRATQSPGPDGSTFKVITSTAALESGTWPLDESYDDTGQWCFPDLPSDCLHNSGEAAYGSVNLISALKVSDDVFFYNLGEKLNADPTTHPNGGPLQEWARKFGIGSPTGVDLPGESAGTLPTPKYMAQLYKAEQECEAAKGPYKYIDSQGDYSPRPQKGYHRTPKRPLSAGGCGIAERGYWSEGDNVNTAVGQGDVQVTPLQLAVVYSALENDGRIVTPRIGMDIQSADGSVVSRVASRSRKIDLDPTYRDAILEGLHEAAQGGGTSSDVMGSFKMPVYGKTGTAQYNGQQDYAWYACFVPSTATSKPIVVVVTVERGGFGDVAAAPVARQILSQWFYDKPGPYISGTSTDQ